MDRQEEVKVGIAMVTYPQQRIIRIIHSLRKWMLRRETVSNIDSDTTHSSPAPAQCSLAVQITETEAAAMPNHEARAALVSRRRGTVDTCWDYGIVAHGQLVVSFCK